MYRTDQVIRAWSRGSGKTQAGKKIFQIVNVVTRVKTRLAFECQKYELLSKKLQKFVSIFVRDQEIMYVLFSLFFNE